MATMYYLKDEKKEKEEKQEQFKKLFGRDVSSFDGVKVYVDSQGIGIILKDVLEQCGIDASTFMKMRDGIILHD